MNYINDNNKELELTEKQFEEIKKLLQLELSPKQIYIIHKEYSKNKNEEWSQLTSNLDEVKQYHKQAIETLAQHTYDEIENVWNKNEK